MDSSRGLRFRSSAAASGGAELQSQVQLNRTPGLKIVEVVLVCCRSVRSFAGKAGSYKDLRARMGEASACPACPKVQAVRQLAWSI